MAHTLSTYIMSTECVVSGTGPISSTIKPMDVDLHFEGRCYGRLTLPEMTTKSGGANVAVVDQLVRITDMTTYQAFVHSVITSDQTDFRMENGLCRIRALMLNFSCIYGMTIPFKGMGGPRMTVVDVQREGQGEDITLLVRFLNPSPIEIDHGMSHFKIMHGFEEEDPVAEMQGDMHIIRGEFTIPFTGKLRRPLPKGATILRISGAGVEGGSWCDETIKNIDVTIDLDPAFGEILEAPLETPGP